MAIAVNTKRLRHARESAGLTRRELAARADLDSTYYGRIEAGKIHPGPKALRRISESLGIDSHTLVLPLEEAS